LAGRGPCRSGDEASRSFFVFRGHDDIFIGSGVCLLWWWVWVLWWCVRGRAPERAHL
jgi:hypothetical protein